jgi:hypothetical protein
VKRRFKHHHERTIETMPQLPERILEHQTFFITLPFPSRYAIV